MRLPLSFLQKEIQESITLEECLKELPMLGFPIESRDSVGEDIVLTIETTANRSDALSIRGIARDLAAKLRRHLVPHVPQDNPDPSIAHSIHLTANACSHYDAAVIEWDRPESCPATPEDLLHFLKLMDITPRGLLVDASNWLMYRYGHPTHVFDLEKIRGAIRVRFATSKEEFIGLDLIKRSLRQTDLVIADEDGPIALAGIIGGSRTMVTATTKKVLIESAWFDPITIRNTAHELGIHTEASLRFGRGADPHATSRQCLDLVHAITGKKGIIRGIWTVGTLPQESPEIEVSRALLQRISGASLSTASTGSALEAIGCRVHASGESLKVVPPSWRMDLKIPEDIAEECIRLQGYETIASAPPKLNTHPSFNEHYLGRQSLALYFAQQGFYQTVTFGFGAPASEATQHQATLAQRTLMNPISQDYSIMRSSLLPALQKIAEQNLRHGQSEVRLFEIAPTFKGVNETILETPTIALMWCGLLNGDGHARIPVQAAHLEHALAPLYKNSDLNQQIQSLGKNMYGIEFPISMLDSSKISIQPMEHVAHPLIPKFVDFSRHPRVERYLSVLAPRPLSLQQVQQHLAPSLPTSCVDFTRIDVFTGVGIPAEYEAWVLRFSFQEWRNLTHDEVDQWIKSIAQSLKDLGIVLR